MLTSHEDLGGGGGNRGEEENHHQDHYPIFPKGGKGSFVCRPGIHIPGL